MQTPSRRYVPAPPLRGRPRSINKTLAMPPDLLFALEDIARLNSDGIRRVTWTDVARKAMLEYVEAHASGNKPAAPPPIKRRRGAK